MSVEEKRALVGRLETQALYGTKVIVIGHDGSAWSQVVVPSQPTNRDSRGYPGWVPSRQLTAMAPRLAAASAIVSKPTGWLWSGWSRAGVTGSRLMEVSFDTILPVVQVASNYVEVRLIDGGRAALRRGDVKVQAKSSGRPTVTRARMVDAAERFVGLQYLWGGTSGFGFDCSGFMYSIYRQFGITLSRDADQQAVHGWVTGRSALKPGDLVFFRGRVSGPVTHVGMYLGGGKMIEAPGTGLPVRISRVSWDPFYAGARRYLTGK